MNSTSKRFVWQSCEAKKTQFGEIYSAGDWCFGYGSEGVPGSRAGRRGRNVKPRMQYVINQEHADWVRKIFEWFVQERRSLNWIAKELTTLGAPKDHRSSTPGWHRDYVRRVLRNRKYVGLWPWGRLTNVRNPLTGRVHQEDRAPEETVRWERERPDLRIIEDDTFHKAQALLDEYEASHAAVRREDGKLAGSIAGTQRPGHLLQGLLRCLKSGHRFKVRSKDYLVCSGYPLGLCNCKTFLPRRLAEQMILDAIGSRILDDPVWRQAVLDAARAAWNVQQLDGPGEVSRLEKDLAAVDLKINKLVDGIETGAADPAVGARLAERRAERDELDRRLASLRRKAGTSTPAPTMEWVNGKLRELHDVIQGGDRHAAARVLRALIGPVSLTEVRPPNRRRSYFRATFRICAAAFAGTIAGSGGVPSEGGTVPDVTIDIYEPTAVARRADAVKALHDHNLSMTAIGDRLGLTPNQVRQVFAFWYEQRRLPVPDNRARRIPRPAPDGQRPNFRAIADEVKQLLDEGLLVQDIAKLLGRNRDTIRAAIRHWHISRGLAVPDGRNRRKELRLKRVSAQKGSTQAEDVSEADDGPAARIDPAA